MSPSVPAHPLNAIVRPSPPLCALHQPLSFCLLGSRTGRIQCPATTPCHLAHPASFRAQLRGHFFWETILSQGKSCQPPAPSQHFGCPLSPQALVTLFCPSGWTVISHWILSFQRVPTGLFTRFPSSSTWHSWFQTPVERPMPPAPNPLVSLFHLLKPSDSAGFTSAYSPAPGLPA